MAILSQPAFGPRASLTYITTGMLLDVWTVVWYFAFEHGKVISNPTWFWLVGLFLTGVTLVVIGVLLGPIGQAARKAEMPPTEAVHAEERIQQTAAAHPAAVMTNPMGAVPSPTMPSAPVAVPTAMMAPTAPAASVPATPMR